MRVLPIPPIIEQNAALNPDGTVDTAHATDCGEACLSSVLEVHTTLHLSPGCIREAMGLPEFNGRSTGQELAAFLECFGIATRYTTPSADEAWDMLGNSRHYGRYNITLAYWIASGDLHWEVVYQRGRSNLWAMDPWNGRYHETGELGFKSIYGGEVVTAVL